MKRICFLLVYAHFVHSHSQSLVLAGDSILSYKNKGITQLSPEKIHNDIMKMTIRNNTTHVSPTINIEELDFSFNNITTVQEGTFTIFKEAALLRLSHNRLTEVSSELLKGLTELRILELGHNRISKIGNDAFLPTPNLQELRIQYNPIFDLPEKPFRHLQNLQKLDLQETGLVSIPSDLFFNTPSLHWLSLSNNAFEMVPEALDSAPLLESLDLSGNDFEILGEESFVALSRLSLLHLNNLKRLVRIDRNALAGLVALKTLSCSYNPKLKYIHQDIFGSENSTSYLKKTPPSQQLYLRENALKTLRLSLEPEIWSSLSFVDLAHNPWRCDCNIKWMTHLRPESQASIFCDTPGFLANVPLNDIDPDDLTCGSRWELATFFLVISSMVAFGVVFLAASAIVCSRSRLGLWTRAKRQFSYIKVVPKTESVDLEWDPSADM